MPPQVTLYDGLLTIVADNSTLGDVLKAVQRVTGASIEDPGGSNERVYFRGGPGAPRDVLASLLNGSRYDYILLGSPQQPKALTRVILSLRQRTAQPMTVAATPARSSPPPPADTTESEDTSEPAIPPPATPVQPQPAATPPAPLPPGIPQPGQPQPGQPAQPGPVRSPEQMLQELQKMQQQQNQQLQLQQQLNQQNGFSR